MLDRRFVSGVPRSPPGTDVEAIRLESNGVPGWGETRSGERGGDQGFWGRREKCRTGVVVAVGKKICETNIEKLYRTYVSPPKKHRSPYMLLCAHSIFAHFPYYMFRAHCLSLNSAIANKSDSRLCEEAEKRFRQSLEWLCRFPQIPYRLWFLSPLVRYQSAPSRLVPS